MFLCVRAILSERKTMVWLNGRGRTTQGEWKARDKDTVEWGEVED